MAYSMRNAEERVVGACEYYYPKYKHACNFFVQEVALALGCGSLHGKGANAMCDYFAANYVQLDNGQLGGSEARILAAEGWLVMVGRKSENEGGHGHVGIITGDALHGKYQEPYLYCGSISNYQSRGNKCIREIFGRKRPVTYWLCPIFPNTGNFVKN